LPILILSGPTEVDGAAWLQVRTGDGREGWILARYVATATPPASPTP